MGENEEGVASPDTPETDGLDAENAAAEDGSESSTETQDGEKADLLSVVRDAVEDDGEGDGGADDPDSPTGQEESESSSDDDKDEGSGQEAAELDDENFTDVPFHKHPRFKALVQQRNQFRQGHEQFATLQSYMRENGLRDQDVADSLQVAALLRSDPEQAWKKLQPVVQDILHQTGRIMPQDLKARVQSGELSQQDALELSRARASQSVQETRMAHAQTAQAQRQQHEVAQAMQRTAADWETRMRSQDADFDKKSEDLQKEVLWLQRRDGMPKDAQGVQAMLEEAHKTVSQRFTAPRQKKPAKKPVTGGGGSGGTAPRKPKSVLDIVEGVGGGE